MRNAKELVLEREELLKALLTNFSTHSDVLGTFLGGSLAAENADEFSDIDLRLVLADVCPKSEFLKELINLPGVLFVETLAESYVVLHFDCFVKVDIFVYYKRELAPSVWLKKIRIFKDDGFLARISEQSKLLIYHLHQEEFNFFLMKFYAYLHEFYRRNQRGERNYRDECGIFLKNCLVAFWYMELGEQPNGLGDWSKYEGKRSKLTTYQQNWLRKYDIFTDGNIFLREISLTVWLVLQKISQHYQLEFDEEKFKKVVEKIKC